MGGFWKGSGFMEKECWKPVNGYESIYEISSFGNLKNIKTGRMMHPSKNGQGYMIITLSKNNHQRMARVHRLVALAFLSQGEAMRRVVNHKDGDKINNNISNLEWVTPKINSKHAVETGLINNDVVVQMNDYGKVIAFYHSTREAANKTGIDYSAISSVMLHDPDRPHAGGYKWSKGSELCGRKLSD